ncbi:Ig-like domain-containing protein, partial [Verminephrobacter aporrectodeae]|uniref:Ig-like domain-containing protein n=1 Tax=Verminephrobacter aporrectodeae TaxID=1110389 RepID=UPI0002377AF8
GRRDQRRSRPSGDSRTRQLQRGHARHPAPPLATITLADTALTAGETTTVSIRFNEPVTGFDASDVVLTDANGTLGALTPNAERTLWTATFTPTDKVGDATNTISV